MRGLTEEAIGEFQTSAKDPLQSRRLVLGVCVLEKGLPQLAIKWYRKGLETPGSARRTSSASRYDLATVYADVGDPENA